MPGIRVGDARFSAVRFHGQADNPQIIAVTNSRVIARLFGAVGLVALIPGSSIREQMTASRNLRRRDHSPTKARLTDPTSPASVIN